MSGLLDNSMIRAIGLVMLAAAPAADLCAQTITGRVVDSENGAAVGLAAVIVLDAERDPLVMSAADGDGRYSVELPGPGSFYLIAERLGYFQSESPLLAVESTRAYAVDMEMRPEPIRLDPLQVTVRNEELEEFLALEHGQHPATIPGYRSVQGQRLQEAKSRAEDNTGLLRELYIPVSHGRRVCVGTSGAPLPPRMSYERINARADAAEAERTGTVDQCGALYVNGHRCRNEFIEEIQMDRIAVVVTFRGSVHLYTRDFDFTFRPGSEAWSC